MEIVWFIFAEAAFKIKSGTNVNVHEFMKAYDIISLTLDGEVLYKVSLE